MKGIAKFQINVSHHKKMLVPKINLLKLRKVFMKSVNR